MKKIIILLFLCSLFLTGCKIKQIEKERMCTRIDIDQIIAMLPLNIEDIDQLGSQGKQVMHDMIMSLDTVSAHQRNFANTIRSYDHAKFQFLVNKHILSVYSLLAADKSLQLGASHQLAHLQKYETDILDSNLSIYQAFKDYFDFGKDIQRKTVVTKNFLRQMLQRFEHHGVSLPVAQRVEVKKLENQINQLAGRYAGNIAYDSRNIVVPVDGLRGVPDSFKQKLSQNDQGDYIVPIDFESFFMVMENCSVEATRKEYFLAFGQRAYPQNISVLQNLIDKRHNLAQIHGFTDFASYQLHNQMVKTPKTAESFLNNIAHALQKYDDQDSQALIQNLPDSVTLTKDNKLKPWDEAFVKSSYRKKHFDLHDHDVASFFPLDHTLQELFRLVHKFFHIEFIKEDVDPGKLWSPDVQCYKVSSLSKQLVVGYLFLDLYKQPHKAGQEASHIMLIPTIKDDCSIACAGASVMIANFNKPTEDGQTLLELSQVRSLFHELGHALHGLFGSTCFADFAGTQVVKDFVEVPSLMLENWLDDPVGLRSISKHYQTGRPLPHEKIEQIIAAQRFGLASRTLKQLFLGLVSLHLYRYGHQKDVHTVVEKLYKKIFKHIAYEPQNHVVYSLSHLAHYAASYYTYVWSRVIAADLFEHVKQKNGMFDHTVGKDYVKDILNPGGFVPPNSMIKKFLKRPFNNKAFINQFYQQEPMKLR